MYLRNKIIINKNYPFIFLFEYWRGGVHTESTWHCGHYWPIVPAPGDCEDGEVGGMKIGRGDRSTQRKPAPAHLTRPGREPGPRKPATNRFELSHGPVIRLTP
jgi:hypothetical protein